MTSKKETFHQGTLFTKSLIHKNQLNLARILQVTDYDKYSTKFTLRNAFYVNCKILIRFYQQLLDPVLIRLFASLNQHMWPSGNWIVTTYGSHIQVTAAALRHLIRYLKVSNLNTKHIDRLVQERCNSSALALELRLSCTNPSIW